MTTERVLALLRRKLAESNLAVSPYEDYELLSHMTDAQEELGLRKSAQGVELLVIDPADGSITPEPTTEQGHVLALKTASNLLHQEYSGRVMRGELGVSWRSGLEEMSTISSEKAWRQAVQRLDETLEELLLIKNSPQTGTRPQ
jgi:hypothetical protein